MSNENSLLDYESTFLPTRKDRLKAEIIDLRQQLLQFENEQRKLKREIMEEKIAIFTASRFAEEIRDYTRNRAREMTETQEQIFEQLMTATSARCVQEVVGYYRLSGRSTFDFQGRYTVIRLETFYNRMYYEPYYLLFQKGFNASPTTIAKHTIPHFIPLNELERQFLPNDQESLLRILQDFLLAYVSRREQIKELEAFAKGTPSLISVTAKHAAKNHVDILEKLDEHRHIRIHVIYKNLVSDSPTDVEISVITPHGVSEAPPIYRKAVSLFQNQSLLRAYRNMFETGQSNTEEGFPGETE